MNEASQIVNYQQKIFDKLDQNIQTLLSKSEKYRTNYANILDNKIDMNIVNNLLSINKKIDELNNDIEELNHNINLNTVSPTIDELYEIKQYEHNKFVTSIFLLYYINNCIDIDTN